MMNQVRLKHKTIIFSVLRDPEDLAKLSNKVLGCLYNPKEDAISIKFVFNPSKKKKGLKTKPDLTLHNIDAFYEYPQSRRSLLSICNGIYDPLGLASSYTVKLKLLMKDTLSVDDPGDWDSPVSSNLIKEWSIAVKEGISQDSLWFPRSTLCTQAVKKPRLVGFWDGSSQAFSTVIYAFTIVSKTGKNNQDVLPNGDVDDKDFDPDLHKFKSHILAFYGFLNLITDGLATGTSPSRICPTKKPIHHYMSSWLPRSLRPPYSLSWNNTRII